MASLTSEQIEALASSGVTSVTIDGQTISIDQSRLARSQARAEREDLTHRANNDALEMRVSLDLSGFSG